MFSDPRKNVMEFGLQPGQSVADFGSGTGHYAFPISEAVGPKGQVYCIDIKKDSLALLKNKATKEGRENIEVIWGDIDNLNGSKLKNQVVDAVIFSNLLFQLGNKEEAIKEAKRILKPSGKIIIIEWSDLSYLNGVKHDGKNIVIKEEDLKKLLEENGFKQKKAFAAGEQHYGLIFGS